jgi:hypothetical protein
VSSDSLGRWLLNAIFSRADTRCCRCGGAPAISTFGTSTEAIVTIRPSRSISTSASYQAVPEVTSPSSPRFTSKVPCAFSFVPSRLSA